jgi:hypothetical protein
VILADDCHCLRGEGTAMSDEEATRNALAD